MRIACNLVATALLAGLAVAPAGAAEPARPSPGLDQLDCRTLLHLSGEERAYTLLYFHGYISGKRNQTQLSTDAMAEATDRILDRCIDKPAEKVLKVFEDVRSAH